MPHITGRKFARSQWQDQPPGLGQSIEPRRRQGSDFLAQRIPRVAVFPPLGRDAARISWINGSEGFGRREAHANCPDSAACADREGEVGSAAGKGHAGTGERMTAAEPLRHTRRDAAHLIRAPRMAEVGQAQW
jgi:hypothetical protein